MLKILTLASTIAIVGAPAAVSQTATTPDILADGFFRNLQSGDAAKAYQYIWGGTFMDKKQAEVEYIITQNATALKTYGKILGWELGSEKVISPSVVERLYILKTEALPLYYKIQFYRPATNWIVGNLYFTDTYKNIP